MKRVAIISLLVITLFSCEEKYPGYTEKDDDVYMELLSFEESDKQFDKAAHTIASIEITGEEGLLYKHYKEDVINLENYELTFLFQYLNEGDSCRFRVPKSKIIAEFNPITFNKTSSDYLDVTIKVHRYYSKAEYLSERNFYDKEMMEQLILTKYLKEFEAKPNQGIYVEQIWEGKGEPIKKGDVIIIAYKGYFVNRLEFDRISGSTAFRFTYGTPGQVIKGLDIAISGMKKGEKSKIIIPSQLAFGEEGSTTDVVPPFTTVIYELEIVNVN